MSGQYSPVSVTCVCVCMCAYTRVCEHATGGNCNLQILLMEVEAYEVLLKSYEQSLG